MTPKDIIDKEMWAVFDKDGCLLYPTIELTELGAKYLNKTFNGIDEKELSKHGYTCRKILLTIKVVQE